MEPCVLLEPRQRALYCHVMQESCKTLLALEFSAAKPDLLSYLDCEEEVTALDLHVSWDTPAAEHRAGAGQEEPAEEKPNTEKEQAQLPVSQGKTHAANTGSECGEIFSHKSALVKHRKMHSGDRPDCGRGFIQRPELSVHPGERPCGCPNCGRSCADAVALAWPQQSHLGKKPFECSECGKAFAWSSHLQRHRRIHTGEKPFECSECGKAFAWSSHLQRHMRTHVTTHVTTGTAGDEEGAQAAQEPPPAPRKCADRGKSLNHRTDPRRFEHKATQTPLAGTDPAPRPHSCEQCGKCFSRRSGLLKHQRVHGSGRLLPWPRCPRRFRCSAALAKHQRSHVQPPGNTGDARPAAEGAAKPYPCGECGKSFGWLSHLERHRRVHTGEKPFRCGECGRGFAVSSHLERHRRVHTGEWPFRCGDCGKSFAASSTLLAHRRAHGAQPGRPHACLECGKGFGSPAGLERHRRLHRGEKPFQCGLCGKGFSWSSHYNRHQRTHTGEKPFPCAHCGKRFGRSSHRTRHQRAHAQHSSPERSPDCGKACRPGVALAAHQRLHGARSPLCLLPPACWEGEARGGTGTSPELWPEEPSSAEGDSLQGNATAPTEPWLSLPPPSA